MTCLRPELLGLVGGILLLPAVAEAVLADGLDGVYASSQASRDRVRGAPAGRAARDRVRVGRLTAQILPQLSSYPRFEVSPYRPSGRNKGLDARSRRIACCSTCYFPPRLPLRFRAHLVSEKQHVRREEEVQEQIRRPCQWCRG
ncbi:MAG: hypothetical protein AVDCRST_MAG37-168 [uncultured Rubrobacteraceae bacterium]|uniref:Uncharacterized protein n=1 Tax=uncultured Rubrobacteraceae bacterium TaxID=349277 RepID=A0A6J4PXB8_9ACTN|nr:MAG: hypothetical protein AVDCRST_MAG37-168 [uncultured Rubrobacteraceae bacterium]